VEIGSTFIARRWQRTHVNTDAKRLMLRHAFDSWQCLRVELLTDVTRVSHERRAGARLQTARFVAQCPLSTVLDFP